MAEMTASGLVLRNSRHVDMLDEDLFVSAEQIRVRYVFRNQAAQDERVVVAFPMPDRDLAEESQGGDRAFVHDFQTMVEGRPVATQIEERAVVGARDIIALLQRLHVPLHPDNVDGHGALCGTASA